MVIVTFVEPSGNIEDIVFSFTKEGLLDFSKRYNHKVKEHVEKLVKEKNVNGMLAMMKDILKSSYKGDMPFCIFVRTTQYKNLWTELLSNSEFTERFCSGLIDPETQLSIAMKGGNEEEEQH